MIRFAAITPHPPIIIPSIGGSSLNLCRKTVNAMKKLGEKFRSVKAETVFLVSPHGPVQYDKFMINYSPILTGSLSSFGDQRRFVFENDRKIIDEIVSAGRRENIPVGLIRDFELDHGALVPLYYLVEQKDLNYNPKLVHMSFSMLPFEHHFQFGRIIGKILDNSPKIYSFIASGDLSHRVTPDAPAGYSPQGKIFDKKLTEFIQKKNIKGVLKMDQDLIEEAGECGLRSIVMLLGTLSLSRWSVISLSYEAPFGVGYMVVNFNIK